MQTTPEQIDLWRKPPSEKQRLEFKKAKSQFDTRKLDEQVGASREFTRCLRFGRELLFKAKPDSPDRRKDKWCNINHLVI